MIVLSCGENCQLKFGIDESNALRDKIVEIIGDGESREGANKSLGTKTHHSKLLILNG